jgi:glycosyltransferase involved in cell wall biosynthesis
MQLPNSNHTFVILAYGDSPYLGECIASLKAQTVPSDILISTSTPSSDLARIARAHEIRVFVNDEKSTIASDWSFGYRSATTRYITLAHQDDIYYPRYTERCLAAAGRFVDNLIIFTDYHDLLGNRVAGCRANLIVKKLILSPFFVTNRNLESRLFKKWMLSFGSPISCPSVMYHKEAIGDFRFSNDFIVNLDWEAWIRLAERAGDFVFVKERLMAHRIHDESATTRGIEAGAREAEDTALFSRIWGSDAGRLLAWMYRFSYFSNG